MLIREETIEDHAAIHALNRLVFGGEYEAELIAGLRSAHQVIVSLVATDGDEVVGHIFFSRLPMEIDGRAVQTASLAPMAVKADRQNQGIGSKLVREGLVVLGKTGIEAVIVLGHTWFYPRFGFSAELTKHLASPFRGSPSFMGLELSPGALAGEKGCVNYPEPFGLKSSR